MERPEMNIYDGCEFDENQNVDWDALEMTEELALRIGGPILTPTSPSIEGIKESSRKQCRDFRFEDDDEGENIKFMRFGSLGRIIASSVVASTPSAVSFAEQSSVVAEPRDDAQRSEKIKCTSARFIAAFNLGDMDRLALLVRELCDEVCLLVTPDVDSRDCIVGRADVMMLFSLILETFPDGVYRTLSTTVVHDRVSIIYSFTGTRVFEQSIDSLYKQCRMHAAVGSGSTDGTFESSTSSHQSFSCELDLIQISKTTTQNSVAIQMYPNKNLSACPDRLQKYPPHQISLQQHQLQQQQQQQQQSQYQQQHIHQTQTHFNPFQTLQHKFTETVTNLMPHAGRLASDAIKEGPIRLKRSMEMYFNSSNQVIRIIFTDIPTVLR